MTARPRGFSFVELMIVLAVGAVALAIAAPAMRDLIYGLQLKAAVNDLFSAIELTRSQAMGRNGRVMLRPADPLGVDWTRGWTVFVDRDRDRKPGPQDEIIAVHGPLAEGITVRFAFTSPAAPYYIAYNGAGRSCSDTSSAQARLGTLSLFQGRHTRRIKINMLGRARVCDPARDAGCDGAEAPP
ncbi:GspH/FimT family pseudopilin [Massilia horti]|uniref:Type II secretion system protein H n=1 Tax=Massilia horti TaxID=2562153 RepID=A0A4Y9T2V2_9BURK|nr:GspH/FimT family pseudopilin [Massilia horti]TFW31265.1 prepilin-type N-terminal cleavage/methylation domain-containing protein [Massilia horti]